MVGINCLPKLFFQVWCGEFGRREIVEFSKTISGEWAVIDSIVCEISLWVLVKKEFKNCSINDMARDWVSCIMSYNGVKHVPSLPWIPPELGRFKVNCDGASFGNPG